MSYILDALRRADAERERGAVPSLHTQQYGALPGDEDDAPRRARVSTIAAVLLAAALVAVVGWHFLSGDAPPRPTVQVIAPVPPVAAAPAPPVEAASTSTAAPALRGDTTTAVRNDAMAASASTDAARRGQARPLADGRSVAARTPQKAAASSAALATRQAPATPAAPAASAGSANDRIYTLADLPDDVRRDLPKLAFGGASYSSAATSRMVIYNGQVFHEGDSIGGGVVLQRVNRKSAILAVRGYRVELAF